MSWFVPSEVTVDLTFQHFAYWLSVDVIFDWGCSQPVLSGLILWIVSYTGISCKSVGFVKGILVYELACTLEPRMV